MLKINLRLLPSIFLMALAAHQNSALAADNVAPPRLEWHLIAGATSDYTYRGVSLNNEKPTPLLYAEAWYGIAYINGFLIGTYLGEDEFGNVGTIEADATAGIMPKFGNVTLNIGAKYTGYPNGEDRVFGTRAKAERDFIEPFAGATIQATDALSFGATAYWTPDFYYETGEVTTLEAQASLSLPAWNSFTSKLSVYAGRVRSEQQNIVAPGHAYIYWNAGIEARLERFIFDLRYWDTDVEGFDGYKGRVVFSAGYALN